MPECEVCGRKFKTMQALGGHAVNAHPDTKENAQGPPGEAAAGQARQKSEKSKKGESPARSAPAKPTSAKPAGKPNKNGGKKSGARKPPGKAAPAKPKGNEASQAEEGEEEASQAELIRNYLQDGYTPEQLTRKQFGFKETTVRQEVAKLIPAEGEKPGGPTRMPMVLKAGAGQELISPEAIIQNYLVPEGDIGVGMLRGFMLYRAAQLAVMTDVEIMKGQSDAQAKALKPIMDIMEQARVDMDAAAQRAKDSNTEIAEMAAAGAAVRAAAHIDARFEEMKAQKPDIASTPDPIKGMMARTMETIMAQVMGALMPGSQTGATPGFVDKRGQGGK